MTPPCWFQFSSDCKERVPFSSFAVWEVRSNLEDSANKATLRLTRRASHGHASRLNQLSAFASFFVATLGQISVAVGPEVKMEITVE